MAIQKELKKMTNEKRLKLQVQDEVKTQLFYIMMKGCSNIKCKNCYLKIACSHEPAKSKQFAMSVLQQGIKQGKA